jgi:CheY-like chemotaxis protein
MPHKLLLADDSVTIQRVIELTFADEDVQVLAVGDGTQAIARLEADRPDIVLADIGMPERDGYEVAAFVKQHPDFRHIPVLLLTGAFEPVDEPRARALGCDGVLVKPFEPQMVISRVKDLLAGRRPAGLWATGAAQIPVRQPAAAGARADLRDQPPAAPGGSLEDYFDRLDAAFASLDASHGETQVEQELERQGAASAAVQTLAAVEPAPAPDTVSDALGAWDPDLSGEPIGPPTLVAAPPLPAAPPVPVASAVPLAPQAAPAPLQPPTMLRSLEVLPEPAVIRPVEAPAAWPAGPLPSLADAFAALLAAEQGQSFTAAPRSAEVSDETIDEIVRRVIGRMSDQAVRTAVVDVAERLVREEIGRIKAHS